MVDVLVIGAGVVGSMIARELSRYSLKVCIADKANDVAMGTTKANSAIVHAGFDAKCGSLKAKLNVEGSRMMEQVASELGVKYKRNGALVVGFGDEDRAHLNELFKRGIKNGVEGLKILEKDEIRKIEPEISDDVVCALYAPTSAVICPYELAIAAAGNAMDNGAELVLNFEVKDIIKEDNCYRVLSENGEIKAKYIVNAAGVYSDKIARMAGDSRFSVTPRRGEYMLLDNECASLAVHTIFQTPGKLGKGILVSPTVDNNIILGPTAEDISDKEDTSTTDAGFAKIIAEAKRSVKSIPLNKTITSFCGLRAVGDSGDFIINSFGESFVNVAGIESPGLSSAPAIAVSVAGMLKDMGLELAENKSFNPYRKAMHAFREASIEEKNKIIKENPAYGKIVCRCETVSEGEILEAIRTNPKPRDLDGVKRRTRSQMGRCQGGFCSPYIVELLSRELGINFEDVTKLGGNSKINLGKTKED